MERVWYEFGAYRFDATTGLLLCEGRPVSLTPKAAQVLRVLVQNRGATVAIEMLLNEVWPGSFVEENNIQRNICDLRKALHKTASSRQYIETVPKRGYRFAARVEELREEDIPVGKTLVIPPFEVLGGFETNLIGRAIVEAVTTKLATVREYTVRSLVSAADAYLGRDPLAVGRELQADFVLHGSVQRHSDAVRVTVRLLRTKSGRSVWAETLDETFADPFSLEDSISDEIAGALVLGLNAEQRKLLARRYTESADAYRLYLKGRFHWNRRSEEGLKEAIQCFKRATELDPEYAPGYSGLASSYVLLPMLSAAPASRFMPRAKAAAITALEIDETLAEARAALAFVKWHYLWDWSGAEREFRRILKFQPNHAVTHQWYALFLAESGRFSEAITHARTAQSIEPASLSIRANLATVLLFTGRFDQAIKESKEVLVLDPSFFRAHWVMGLALEQRGELPDAISELERAHHLCPNIGVALGALSHCYGRSGRTKDAQLALRRLAKPQRGQPSFSGVALAHLGLGHKGEALGAMEMAFNEKEFYIVTLRVDRRLDVLAGSPRYESILKKVGLSK